MRLQASAAPGKTAASASLQSEAAPNPSSSASSWSGFQVVGLLSCRSITPSPSVSPLATLATSAGNSPSKVMTLAPHVPLPAPVQHPEGVPGPVQKSLATSGLVVQRDCRDVRSNRKARTPTGDPGGSTPAVSAGSPGTRL